VATLTQFLKLYKPATNEVGWDDNMNANLDTLDGFIRQFMNVPNFVGTWTNAHAYAVGQSVMEFETGNFFACAVAHTSAVSGTMAADRTAHPTFWGAITTPGNAAANAAAASATAAQASATQAATSATAATSQLNGFRQIYYGAFATDPVADPLGGARTVGDLYFNTTPTVNAFRVWNGTVWVTQPTPSGLTDAPVNTTTAYGRRNAAWVPVVPADGGRINTVGGTNGVKGTLVIGDQTVPAAPNALNGSLFADFISSTNGDFYGNAYVTAPNAIRYITTGVPAYRIKATKPIGNATNYGIQIIIGTLAQTAGQDTGIGTASSATGIQLQLDQQGSLNILGATAAKAGAGQWVDRSDARIKNIIGPYPAGLAQMLEMTPQMFTYKGNDNYVAEDGSVGPVVHPDTTTQFIGLVAQECEPYMPELVKQTTGYIDGVLQTDIRVVDPTAVMYALVNSVIELNTMITALTARVAALEAGP